MNQRIALTLSVLMIANVVCLCTGSTRTITPTPTPPPPTNEPGVPTGQNERAVNGSEGTPSGGIPVYCENAGPGNVDIPAESFERPDPVPIEISCLSPEEKEAFDQAVETFTGETGEVLGAIKLGPTGMQFDSFVTITIPLLRRVDETEGDDVPVYVFRDDNTSMAPDPITGRISAECDRWCATASVDHFTTFVAYKPVSQITPQSASAPVIEKIDFPSTPICDGRQHNMYIHFHDENGDINRYTQDFSYEGIVERIIDEDPYHPNINLIWYDYIPYLITGDSFAGVFLYYYFFPTSASDVTVRATATLYDQTGLKSNPYEFTFTCQAP